MANKLSTTKGELYLVELVDPFERLEIQFVPRELDMPRKADLAKMRVIGRNNDLLHYTGGSNTLKLPLEFYSDDDNQYEDVIAKVNWLQSLAMKDGFNGPYRNVKLVFGDVFRYEIWAVESVDPKIMDFMDDGQWRPLRATVNVSLILDPITNLLINDVRRRARRVPFVRTEEF